MVFRDLEQARETVRPVISAREQYPLLGWEAARLLALLDGGILPSAGSLIEGLDQSIAEALENRPV